MQDIEAAVGEADPQSLPAPFGDAGVEIGQDARIEPWTLLAGKTVIAQDAIIVIDYKSGSGSFKTDDLREGRSVQMLVYLRAAQRLLAGHGETARVVGGAYWHIGSRAISGAVTAADAALDDAEARLHSHVMAARAGRFVVRPSKPMKTVSPENRTALPAVAIATPSASEMPRAASSSRKRLTMNRE